MSCSLKDGSVSITEVNEVPTTIYSRLSPTVTDGSSLVLCVPGSPGMAQYYVPFVDHLYNLHEGNIDVCVVSHVGHSPGTRKEKDTFGRDWYNLQDQINHKIAFINQYYPNLQSLYLIGHSIGCYILLNMLDDLPAMKKCILLFPAIERFSQTPNAYFQRPFFKTFRWLGVLIVWLLTLLPLSVRRFALQVRFKGSPPAHRDSIINATLGITSTGIYNMLSMADEEYRNVNKLPVQVISRHHDKLILYYGVGDQWNLPSFYHEFTDRFPHVDATLCCHGFKHAFVLESSHEMAEFCYKKLN